jgi:hypothetical protein
MPEVYNIHKDLRRIDRPILTFVEGPIIVETGNELHP